MTRPVGYLPGYGRVDGVLPQHTMRPQIVTHDGKKYLVHHAAGLTAGVVRSGGDEGTDVPAVTIWHDGPNDMPLGLALTFLPDDDMLDAIIASLTGIRDRQRARAVDLAEAAFAKAGGK